LASERRIISEDCVTTFWQSSGASARRGKGPHQVLLAVDHPHVAEHQSERGIGHQQLNLATGLLRQPDVVGIEHGYQVACGLGQRPVDCSAWPAVRLLDEVDAPGMTLDQRCHDRRGRVGGAVINHHHRQQLRWIVLRQRALDRTLDVLRVVVGRHQHTHCRHPRVGHSDEDTASWGRFRPRPSGGGRRSHPSQWPQR
jgi:hypothetical protein